MFFAWLLSAMGSNISTLFPFNLKYLYILNTPVFLTSFVFSLNEKPTKRIFKFLFFIF